MAVLTKRADKGSELTVAEMDANLTLLNNNSTSCYNEALDIVGSRQTEVKTVSLNNQSGATPSEVAIALSKDYTNFATSGFIVGEIDIIAKIENYDMSRGITSGVAGFRYDIADDNLTSFAKSMNSELTEYTGTTLDDMTITVTVTDGNAVVTIEPFTETNKVFHYDVVLKTVAIA
jgi:hypothetical protein